MSQAERGLFEQIKNVAKVGEWSHQFLVDKEQLALVCQLFEQRLAEAERELTRLRELAKYASELVREVETTEEHGDGAYEAECPICVLMKTIDDICKTAPQQEQK